MELQSSYYLHGREAMEERPQFVLLKLSSQVKPGHLRGPGTRGFPPIMSSLPNMSTTSRPRTSCQIGASTLAFAVFACVLTAHVNADIIARIASATRIHGVSDMLPICGASGNLPPVPAPGIHFYGNPVSSRTAIRHMREVTMRSCR